MKIILPKISYILVTGIFSLQFISCQTNSTVRSVKSVKIFRAPRVILFETGKDTTKNICFPFPPGLTFPHFPGGRVALMKYLRNHTQYPSLAKREGIYGIVVVQFLIQKDGSISDVITIGHKKGGGLEEEAVRVVKTMPQWIPCSKNGKKIALQYSLPIKF